MWPPGTPATAALRAELIGPGSNHSALEWITAATQALSMSIAIAAMVIVVTHPSECMDDMAAVGLGAQRWAGSG